MIRHNGGIYYLINLIGRSINSPVRCEFGCACLVGFVNLFTANNTVAIVVAGPVAKELAERFGCDRRRIAAILDSASCAVQGIIPYGAQVLIAVGTARSAGVVIPVNKLLSELYYPMLLGAALIVFILCGAFFRRNIQRKE